MPPAVASYQRKFEQIVGQTCFALLPGPEQAFVRARAEQWRFTGQELRLVSEMALDRASWKEAPLSAAWPGDGTGDGTGAGDPRAAKKRLLAELAAAHRALREAEHDYDAFGPADRPRTVRPVLRVRSRPALGLGRCPVASERTRCCNLLTLDAVEKCGFDCSYCSIQSFYHGNEVVFDRDFADRLAQLELDPGETYHIGTGQSSDSLMWGNHQGVLAALADFAGRHPNVILELKTKSKNIGWLLDHPVPANVLCTWSLNPQPVIDHVEHGTASLDRRLDAARQLADRGRTVGFHFHPIIRHRGWQEGYGELCARLTAEFDPEQVAMVSLGTLTFTPAVIKTIRRRALASRILQLPLEPVAGKLSYPVEIKTEMFRHVYEALAPWHGRVFFYLCMEPPELWQPVFGYGYDDNAALEQAMKDAYRDKIAHAGARAAQ